MSSLTDPTPYASVVRSMESSWGEAERLVSLFERPARSDLDRATVAILCTGKYRTRWRGAPLMKDALSWVILTTMLQEVRPRVVFDLGTCGGGAAVWLADLCKALELDTKIVTVDIEDLRTDDARARMASDTGIDFRLGDLTRPETALPAALLAELPHPWIVLEDAHVSTLPLLTHLHIHGMKEGDYIIFEDTHPEGPNVSGMGAHDMERYETDFGERKTKAVALALCVFSEEYKVDTRYTDMFGLNATIMTNGIFRRVEPLETARIRPFDAYEELSPVEITRHLVEDGHVLLRPREAVREIPYGLLPELLGVSRHDLYQQGSELRSSGEDSRYLEVTRFPADQWIPPHHELYYTTTPPARVAFVCLTPPAAGGETSLYDGKRAFQLLPSALQAKCAAQKVRWRRHLGAPNGSPGLSNTSWSRVFGVATFEEALQRAQSLGYALSAVDEASSTMTIDCLTPMVEDECLATSLVGNHPWIYEKFYDGAKTSHEEPLWDDGSRITEQEMRALLEAYVRARVQVRWTRRGEVLMLDNRRFAHGRQPTASLDRVIVVMMGS